MNKAFGLWSTTTANTAMIPNGNTRGNMQTIVWLVALPSRPQRFLAEEHWRLFWNLLACTAEGVTQVVLCFVWLVWICMQLDRCELCIFICLLRRSYSHQASNGCKFTSWICSEVCVWRSMAWSMHRARSISWWWVFYSTLGFPKCVSDPCIYF